jgi:hypothetical protein
MANFSFAINIYIVNGSWAFFPLEYKKKCDIKSVMIEKKNYYIIHLYIVYFIKYNYTYNINVVGIIL